MMQEQNYPDYEEHKLQLDNMILKVTKYIDEYRIDKTRTIEDVAVFLKTWLVNHINGTDQKYVPYLK